LPYSTLLTAPAWDDDPVAVNALAELIIDEVMMVLIFELSLALKSSRNTVFDGSGGRGFAECQA